MLTSKWRLESVSVFCPANVIILHIERNCGHWYASLSARCLGHCSMRSDSLPLLRGWQSAIKEKSILFIVVIRWLHWNIPNILVIRVTLLCPSCLSDIWNRASLSLPLLSRELNSEVCVSQMDVTCSDLNILRCHPPSSPGCSYWFASAVS